MREHLSENKSTMNVPDEAGFCPIHTACALSMVDPENSPSACEIVNLLLQAGADRAVKDTHGNTPLHWAARAGDDEVVRILLQNNCPSGELTNERERERKWDVFHHFLSCGQDDKQDFLVLSG